MSKRFNNPILWGIFAAIIFILNDLFLILTGLADKAETHIPLSIILLLTPIALYLLIGFAYYQHYKQSMSSQFRIKMLITSAIIALPIGIFEIHIRNMNVGIAFFILMSALYTILAYFVLAIPGDLLSNKSTLREKLHNPILWGIFFALTGSAFEKIALSITGPGILLLLFALLAAIIVGFAYYQCYKQQISSMFRIKMLSIHLIIQWIVIFMSNETKAVGLRENMVLLIIISLFISALDYFILAIPGYFLSKREKH